MKTGIIVYSQTNNTFSVGERLRDALAAAGHDVALERVTTVMEGKSPKQPVVLVEKPDASQYDYVILAGPVQAFSLAAVMKAYMAQLAPLSGKKVSCFVTQQFKKPWLGGNHAIRQMTQLAAGHGGKIERTGIINWSNSAREEQISALIASFTETAAAGSGHAR